MNDQIVEQLKAIKQAINVIMVIMLLGALLAGCAVIGLL